MNIIKHNPFRVLGLTANATERELQKQVSIIKRYAEVGKTKAFDYDFNFIGEISRNQEEVQEASNRIKQDNKKLIYALFWFIKHSRFDEIAFNKLKLQQIDKAIEIWDKTLKEKVSNKNFSSYQNLSTLYLALSVVDNQVDLHKLQAGISLKGKLIHSENLKDFSELVTGNGIVNNPTEISRKFVDEVLHFLKPYINKSNGISIKKLISLFNSYPKNIEKYVTAKFTEAPISNIENKIEKTARKRKGDPRNANKYGEELYIITKNDLTLLKKLLGKNNLHYQMLSDKIANEILQCSVDFFNDRQENDSDDNFDENLEKTIKLVKLAKTIATSQQVKNRATENLNTLIDMKDRAILQAIALLRSIKDAYEINKEKIMTMVKIKEASLGLWERINWDKVEEMIKNSINWNKAVELILKVIPEKNIDKIRNSKSELVEEYKTLVTFVLDNIGSYNKRKIRYLKYWQPVKTRQSLTTTQTRTTSSISNSNSTYLSKEKDLSYLPLIKWGAGIAVFLLVVGLIWGEDGLKVVFKIVAFIGSYIFFVWLLNSQNKKVK